MSIGWNFPKTNWGSEQGKNDPGLETFKGNPYPALAREPIQNSLDAHDGSEKPVRVEFSVFRIAQDQFPGRTEYIKVLKQCIKEAKNGSETQKEMEKALYTIENDEIYFMKISDYHTVGLSGSDELRNTNWHRLIKVVGESEKEDTSGGAFGIGKHAPFVCSDIKAVFYATKDSNGKQAFQGVGKLITFTDQDGEPCQATGFYGENDKIQPIKDMSKVKNKDIFIRNKTGTDLFVAGFDYRETWADEIIEAVISSFFVAILEGALEVKVGKHEINKNSLYKYIEKLKESGSKANVINYYEVMTSENTTLFEEEDFEGLGHVKLYIANKKNYNKKIAMVRKSGMLIKEKQNYQIPNKYAGVLLIKGDEFNKQLKRVENPTHTDWEFKRKKDVKVIRTALSKLYNWMNNKAKALSPVLATEEFDVDELSQFLPDDRNESYFHTDQSELEGEYGQPLQSKLDELRQKPRKSKSVSDWEDEDGEEAVKTGKGKQEGSDQSRTEYPKSLMPSSSEPSSEKVSTAKILKYKLFCLDPTIGKYRINLNVKKAGELIINLEILGEDSDMPALISKATLNGNILPVNRENIGPFKALAGSNRIDFKLEEKARVKMGVNFNGR
ncbi:hypothetical protein [Bacillus cereus]|uniref:hypothetical protein n=1 Tax=Bacillus cereus TaxID=1396 RepID=UPI0009428F6D|nr:hypothetical protein [Bacillus cereus]ONG59533.1 hypothetical protein BKL48_25200 [Bacillus cereus]GCF82069.1 hypothetical protein BCACH14_40450 [Bacillus cereus]HDR8165306.1 hypothetical protein [Bacillus cereus]